jgi:serine/threonine-protein kinase
MPTTSLSALVDAIEDLEILAPGQLKEIPSLRTRFAQARDLARELINRDWLTPFQANQLLTGQGQNLVLGQYLLLERLGKGGMGRVYKARHRRLNRLVVLKLIRPDRASAHVGRRFCREIQAVAQLNHPNVVRAFDADEVDGNLLLVMEYIEGSIDLAELVTKSGPLPVEWACDFIAQAALGLQHAFERGLVHRDIKPSNLLLAGGGPTGAGTTIKILDLGLARVLDDADDDPVTRVGIVLGTPDYMAPEQGMDSRAVDIRADIYSLGCTMYFLLTGQVPFRSRSAVKKLLMHQRIEPPRPIETVRPEVSGELAAVLRKMMAKKPKDRYQEPRDVADALRQALNQSPAPLQQSKPAVPAGPQAAVETRSGGSTPVPSTPSVAAGEGAESLEKLPFDFTATMWERLRVRDRGRLVVLLTIAGALLLTAILVLVFGI